MVVLACATNHRMESEARRRGQRGARASSMVATTIPAKGPLGGGSCAASNWSRRQVQQQPGVKDASLALAPLMRVQRQAEKGPATVGRWQ